MGINHNERRKFLYLYGTNRLCKYRYGMRPATSLADLTIYDDSGNLVYTRSRWGFLEDLTLITEWILIL